MTTQLPNARIDVIAQSSVTIGETIFPKEYDASFINLSSIDATLPPELFIEMLNERQIFSHFEMSIGSTKICESEDLFISATYVEAPKGIDPTISSNVWKIDIVTAYNHTLLH